MVTIHHYDTRLTPQPARVVIRPFHIAPDGPNAKNDRVRRIVDAVLAMDEPECARELDSVNADFATRHWQTKAVHLQRFAHIAKELGLRADLSLARRELIGAFFCHEYSYAAAAVMNPSIVQHPDQSGLAPGDLRFLMSVRTVGEGHISSITFREGIVSANGDMRIWPQPDLTLAANSAKMLPNGAVEAHRPNSVPISGSVIFPFTPAQRNGLEDLRLTRFEDESGYIYHGAYTAYSGTAIRSELLTTPDFSTFTLSPMTGDAARNKGMALFPRRIDGDYAMIGRQDGESVYFLQSKSLTHWSEGSLLIAPKHPWELVQIGNCGAPIELDEGWLLLTHGVGAMRKYAIGAALLDRRNPRKLIGRMPTPLLAPSDNNRAGYVPNVLYTCGALRHGDQLFLPYGVADSSISFALIDLKSLLAEMV